MSDDPAKIILGDTAISAIERSPRRFFRRRQDRQTPPLTHCENCGAALQGHWCAQCGQPAIDYRRSFRHVIVDVLESFLNWDSKFFATVGWLVVRPWHLTNDFLSGHRVRYLHPLRLYLLASILFFLAVNYWAKSLHLDPSKLSAKERANIAADISTDKTITPEARAKIERTLQLNSPTPAASPSASAGLEPNEKEKKEGDAKGKGDFGPFLNFGSDNPSTPFEKWLQARAKEKIGEHGTNAQLFFMTVVSNLPYMMLCCIPLFAFVLKILYIWRRVFYIDHLIYALHIHSFAYVGTILIGLIEMGLSRTVPHLLANWVVGILWFLFAVIILLSIRRVYRQGWFFTIFKFFAGGFVYMLVLFFALAATFFITLVLP
ncbi:MAG: DUF3667 domain-containing protein [Spartobacteria bacterium]